MNKLDAFRNDIKAKIKKFGFSIIHTFTSEYETQFSYTIGLADKGHPELIVFGLPHEIGQVILNDAAQRLIDGTLPIGQSVEGLANFGLFFQDVNPEQANQYIIQANSWAGKKLPAIQMVWPDSDGLFPWESVEDQEAKVTQPILFNKTILKPKFH